MVMMTVMMSMSMLRIMMVVMVILMVWVSLHYLSTVILLSSRAGRKLDSDSPANFRSTTSLDASKDPQQTDGRMASLELVVVRTSRLAHEPWPR